MVATKYADGDPGDHFCIGYYHSSFIHFGERRYLVTDANGKQFRANGFRRVERVGNRRGTWMVEHIALIEKLMNRFSVWHWYRAPWKELQQFS